MGTEDGRILMQLGGAARAYVERDNMMNHNCLFWLYSPPRQPPKVRHSGRDSKRLMQTCYKVDRWLAL